MIESANHHDSENGDREQPSCSGDRVVDPRCDASAIPCDRIHYRRGERGHTYRHADSENDNRRKKSLPVTAADTWNCKKSETESCNHRTGNKRNLWTVFFYKTARPSR